MYFHKDCRIAAVDVALANFVELEIDEPWKEFGADNKKKMVAYL